MTTNTLTNIFLGLKQRYAYLLLYRDPLIYHVDIELLKMLRCCQTEWSSTDFTEKIDVTSNHFNKFRNVHNSFIIWQGSILLFEVYIIHVSIRFRLCMARLRKEDFRILFIIIEKWISLKYWGSRVNFVFIFMLCITIN